MKFKAYVKRRYLKGKFRSLGERKFVNRVMYDRHFPANPRMYDHIYGYLWGNPDIDDSKNPDMVDAGSEIWDDYAKAHPRRVLVDGLSPKDIARIKKALRQAWAWSTPRRLCLDRAVDLDGFPRCEKCRKKVPKVQPDHIVPCGQWDSRYVERMFCPSTELQALCTACHKIKTKQDLLDIRGGF